ncbi:ABC transporter substrate-binding protein [Paraliomyxa miuraensis]|uniref:ABC transporter substrate-binding protein n=1 Tax=Paraliomyxa miuraensis TaxID=376150 RepID=UPI0022533C51|nr:ABC transporter substrate-binding protein [Paraliomyxa miuraensis]MCX4246673.1 ABC transporter substrate-binding protein [Paraliomyxa miuraensis]
MRFAPRTTLAAHTHGRSLANQTGRGWGLALGLAGLATAGCSVVLDFPQCVDDVDCTNAAGTELVCRDSQCVEPIPPSTVACVSDGECQSVFDESVVCGVGNVCAALTTERCELRIRPEGVASQDVVYIGSILPVTGTYEIFGAPLENAVQLAVEDFNSSATLPGGKRVAWVACDSQGSAVEAAAAASELVAAGVQAIIGPGLSSETVDVANVTASSGVLLMSPTASARVLGQLNDNGLVWRTVGSDAMQAAGIADRIATLEPVPTRVVALVKNDLYGQTLIEDLAPRLSDVLPGNGLGTLLHRDLDSFASTDELLSEYGARVASAFDADPQVIVILGSVEARELVLFYLEAWSNADPRPALPRFLVSSEAVPMLEPIVEAVSDNFKLTLMNNLEGITHDAQDPSAYDPFKVRYEIRFPNQQAGLNAGLAYDATMSVLLAQSALASGDGTGVEIAGAIARLANPSGTPVSFGQGLGFIATVQDALANGGDVQLTGISGLLEFDPDSGNLRRNLTGWDVVPVSGTTNPRLRANRRYVLDAAPAVTGTWEDL